MQNSYYDNVRYIDSIIDSKNFNAEVLAFLKDEKYRNYFLSQDLPLQWFDILIKEGFFDAKTVPFEIRYWAPLDYFRKLSILIKEEKDVDGISVKLLNVIKAVTEYRNETGNSIDNYFVWHAFNEILHSMPNGTICKFLVNNKVDFNDWLSVWLRSTYDTSVVARDLSEQLLPKFITDDPNYIEIAEKIVLCLLEINFKLNEEIELTDVSASTSISYQSPSSVTSTPAAE